MVITRPASNRFAHMIGLEDMLAAGVVCEGVTVVNDEGFPTLHKPSSTFGKGSVSSTRVRREIGVLEHPGHRAEEIDVW